MRRVGCGCVGLNRLWLLKVTVPKVFNAKSGKIGYDTLIG